MVWLIAYLFVGSAFILWLLSDGEVNRVIRRRPMQSFVLALFFWLLLAVWPVLFTVGLIARLIPRRTRRRFRSWNRGFDVPYTR